MLFEFYSIWSQYGLIEKKHVSFDQGNVTGGKQRKCIPLREKNLTMEIVLKGEISLNSMSSMDTQLQVRTLPMTPTAVGLRKHYLLRERKRQNAVALPLVILPKGEQSASQWLLS